MKRWLLLIVMLVLLVTAGNFGMAATDFNYADVSAKSILYYEASWCGSDAGTNRLNWRGPCHTDDGKDVSLDLTGGFHDAGDHVKFGLPQGYAASCLGWTLYEYKDTLTSKGQYDYLYKISKHFTDYFIKCHPNANTFYYQIGEGNADHAYWGPPELQPLGRQTYAAATPSTPASEMCGEAAAALALMSINSSDTTYKSKCLTTAKSIYTLGKTYIGRGTGQSFYQSGPVYDELTWAAVWLYYATNDSQYLTDADTFIKAHLGANGAAGYVNRWTMCWDDIWAAVFVKLYQATNAQVYKDCIEANLSYWMTGIATTPGGLKYLDSWGVLRYTAAECAIALLYSDISGNTSYRDFAKTQIDYILGNNPRNSSYVVGYGTNYPKFPHHRAASGRLEGQPADEKKTQPEKHILYGALVGGPKSDDSYVDDVEQYVYTEVACDYNAGFVNAMAGMTKYYGASQTAQAIPAEPEVREFYVDALVMGESGSEIKIQTFIHNDSIHPPHYDTGLSYRYFVDLSEMYSKGYTIANVTVGTYNNPNNATISALTPWNEANRIYYVEISWAGKNIFGKSEFQLVFTSYSTGALSSSNDYSRTGLTTTLAVTDYIPVYRNGVKIYGNEPPRSGTPTPTRIGTVTATPTPTIPTATSTPTPTIRVATPTQTASPTVTRRVTPTSRPSSTPARRVTPTRGATPTPTQRVTPTVTRRGTVTATPTPTRAATPTPTRGGGNYVVNYVIQSDWGNGATINVTIINQTTAAVNGWTLAFTFPGNQTITNLWNGTHTQSGASVSVKDAGSNANIGANGGSVNFGFNINYSGTNAKPASFTLNGTACQVQ